MSRLTGSLVTDDETFKAQIGALLRGAAVPVSIGDERSGRSPDVVVVDGRRNLAGAVGVVEQLRAADATTSIFFVADSSNPDVILGSMRAGANEFFPWPPAREAVDEAVLRASTRRASAPQVRSQSNTIVFFGVKGGAGTTTMAVNCGVEVARLSKSPTVLVDLKPGLGEVSVFLGVRNRYSLLDALDNLHRLDADFLRELVTKHKSGLEILAGSDLFDRPGPGDTTALEEVFRLLGKQYEHVIVDAGSQLNSCAVAALYSADTICLVATPDVPSVRNAQRLLDRIGQLGPTGDRVRVLLNRAAEPYPIPLFQIEKALGHKIDHTFPSDYKTVSAALNTGVPLALSANTEMAAQFDKFTRRMLNEVEEGPAPVGRRSTLGLQRLASLW
jgi:pilus assembly protein CpaE